MKRKQKIVFKNDHEDEFNIGEHEDEKSKSIEISKKFIKLTSFRLRQDSNNTIKNTKYTVLNFIPYLIFYQFNTKSSAYFILIMFLQLNDKICVSSKFASFFPFIFILCIAATNELIDDFKRYQRDNLSNNITYNVYSIGSSDYRVVDNNFFELMEYYSEVKSADLKVGNIILIKKGQKVPADCLLLCTSDENNEVYIKTDQLDGETDWKKREAISNIRELDTEMIVQYEEPSNEIYSFTGILETKSMPPQKIPLELSNTAWADTTIANSDVLGLIIYTGNNTRVKMNTYKPRNKVGIFDKEVDLFSIILIVISALSTLTFVIMRGSHYPSFDILIFTLRFLVLFSYIIPIALKVMINISRLYYSYYKPNGVGIRSSSIQEELARITYFLTDKTGTLTCNVMTLKKLHLGTVCFSTSSIEDFKFLLKSYLSHSKGEFNNLVKSGNTKIIIGMNMMFELLEALSICHLVTPVLDGDNITFQASSAEEVAMVQFLEKIGIQLYSKIDNIVSIKYTIDDVSVIVKYKIHVVFSFSSELKRMGIVAQRIDFFEFTKLNISGKFNEYVFFIKGADSVIIPLCKKSPWALEESDNMAREGLRTLLFAKKELQTEEFEEFYKRYSDAKISIYNRGEKLLKVQNGIEVNCDLLGLSGIEDKLQEGVRETIEKLRGAEIKVWMLTGDKIHTAISIAKSSKLISRIDKYKVIENCVNKEEILKVLNEIEKKSFNSLVIDGTSIGTILKHSERIFNSKNRITILDKFISITTKLSTVIGCRFTPTQKAMIARVMKKGDKGAVCCIGDGGNDVSMITEANVGIGIEGKEGNQAALAADFSLKSFKGVIDLLFVHGRRCYHNSSLIAHLAVQRGTKITVMQAIFSALISSYPISVLQKNMSIYFITFTSIPLFALFGCYDVIPRISKNYPELYHEMKINRLCSLKEFVFNNLIAYITGVIISLYFAVSKVNERSLFSVCIFLSSMINEYFMILIVQVNRFGITFIFIIVSLFLFFALNSKFPEFEVRLMLDKDFIGKLLLINILAMLPKLIIKTAQVYLKPSSHIKLSRKENANLINSTNKF